MTRKLLFLVMALMLILPVTLLAGSKDYKGTRIKINETPIQAPRDTVFDECGPPDNTSRTWDLDQKAMGPYKLFDDFYFIGTSSVGAFVMDTRKGLVIIDAGWGAADCGMMMDQLQVLGFNPADIKLILISHEHIDHYGCINEWKEFYCPSAKVAMSQLGWNYLRTWPAEAAYDEPRPESIDMYLTDGQRINLGKKTIKIVATPGHSPGCVSFIIPVRDRGKKHVIGIMGGTGAPRSVSETLVYWTSVEYFKQKAIEAKCDIGLGVHASSWKDDFEAIQTLKHNDPNPLVIGTERFVTEYIQGFYNIADDNLDKLPLEHFAPGCPASVLE